MRKLVLLVVAALLLGACAAPEPEDTPSAADEAPAGETTFGPEEVSLGEALAQIRGHHDAAVALYRDGEVDLALVHAGHPIEEILASVAGELDEHVPHHAEQLSASLEEVKALIGSGAGKSEVGAATQRTADLTFEAQGEIVGPDSEDPAFIGSVVAALLGTAAHEYEEAVAGSGGVSLLEEYQDAFAFAAEARDLYEQIIGDVEGASAAEAEEIEEAFDELEAALPSLEEPDQPVPAAPVEDAVELIGHELEETVGAVLLESSDPAEVVANIEELLDQVVAAYAAGDEEAAGELAAEAYLENYEVIEAGVIENAPEVNEELEPLLGADLRKEISAGVPVEDIEAMAARAKELLAEALAALEGEH